ncbi:hypothetical protein SAMN06265361_10652 [Laceyella tengchongensis]|jgi:hypothetical protein|uniref:Uncharacterized protein n=1 Tax=Laceyella tengchongensis TaxID=574699 RepID=A0AA45WQY7_9BACL|nr:hypothetical protein SAMN06265361_10652 [Laceyella tengchongensis]
MICFVKWDCRLLIKNDYKKSSLPCQQEFFNPYSPFFMPDGTGLKRPPPYLNRGIFMIRSPFTNI